MIAAGPHPAEWRRASVVSLEPSAVDMVALAIRPLEPTPHLAGQHYEIRFPGEELTRNYSIVSSPRTAEQLEFGVKVLPTGMLSRRLAASVAGEELEIRGPLGQAFVWTPEMGAPLVLIGAGAGITPLLAMFDTYIEAQHGEHLQSHDAHPLFIVTAKNADRVFRYDRYRDAMITRFTATAGRLDATSIAEILAPVHGVAGVNVRVCGPGGFITAVVDTLLNLGFEESRIRSEAFV